VQTPPDPPPRLVVYGCGTLGALIAAEYAAHHGACVGYTRTPERHPGLRERGVTPAVGSPFGALHPDDHLLLALPGTAAQRAAITELAAAPPPSRVVLISSTGYYGQPAGAVDEDTPPGPEARSREIAETEQLFRAWAGPNGVILRTAGLYQRGRGPLSALRHSGRPPLGPPDRTLGLIHYEDAAAAACAALIHPAPEPVYLAVIPPCPSRRDFYLAACVVLDLADPTFDAPLKLPPAVYDNSRLRRDLLPEPRHPRWQESLLP
jgi:nucleoside-diphosphate-sugar epimerase